MKKTLKNVFYIYELHRTLLYVYVQPLSAVV